MADFDWEKPAPNRGTATETQYDWEAPPPGRAVQETTPATPPDPGMLSKLNTGREKIMDMIARGMRIPGGGKTVDGWLNGMGQIDNTVTTGGLDAGMRVKNALIHGNFEGLPPEDFQKIKPAWEILEKRFGMHPVGAIPLGLMLSGGLSPWNRAMGLGESAAGAINSELRPATVVGEKIAEKTFLGPLRKPLADITKKYRDGGRTAQNIKTQVWNEGEPILGGLGKGNVDIGEQLTQARKNAYKPIGEAIAKAGGDETFHLAPTLEDAATTAMHDSIHADVGSDDPKALVQAIQDAPSPWDWLKGQLAGKKPDREAALALLRQHVPDLADEIKMAGKHLANSNDKENSLKFFNNLVNDLEEGPRTLDGLHDMKVSYSNAAAKNMEMGSNQYGRAAMANPAKTADMHAAQAIADKIDSIIENKLGTSAATQADKAKYSALRRLEIPLWNKIGIEEARDPMGYLQMLAAGGAGAEAIGHGNLYPLAVAAAAKTGMELQRQPKYGMLAGRALNTVSKSNIWDDMLRSGYLGSQIDHTPQKREPLAVDVFGDK